MDLITVLLTEVDKGEAVAIAIRVVGNESQCVMSAKPTYTMKNSIFILATANIK